MTVNDVAVIANPIVTLVVGFFAFWLYSKQKKDEKKMAANRVLLEVQHVEKTVALVDDAIRNDSLNNVEFDVLREDAWKKYSHLLSKNFDNDEKELLSNFFQNAKLLDESIKKNRESFNEDVAQIRVNKQRILADLAVQAMVNPSSGSIELFNQKTELFDKMYQSVQGKYLYTPMKYKNDARRYCDSINNLSVTSIGIKLKKIASGKQP